VTAHRALGDSAESCDVDEADTAEEVPFDQLRQFRVAGHDQSWRSLDLAGQRGESRLDRSLGELVERRGGDRAGAGQRQFGRPYAMLVGDLENLPESLKSLSTTGLLAREEPKKIGRWIDAAVGAGLLKTSDDVYRTLSLTKKGRDVMAGRSSDADLTLPEPPRPRVGRAKKAAKIVPPLAAGGEAAQRDEQADYALLAALKLWRRREASERALPAYVVLDDRTLAAIAALRPRSLEDLAAVPGIGPAKLAAYGKALLELIASG